jgi:hypothetical protein
MIFTAFIILAILVFLLIAWRGGFAVGALIQGAIAAVVLVLVGWLLASVIGGGIHGPR